MALPGKGAVSPPLPFPGRCALVFSLVPLMSLCSCQGAWCGWSWVRGGGQWPHQGLHRADGHSGAGGGGRLERACDPKLGLHGGLAGASDAFMAMIAVEDELAAQAPQVHATLFAAWPTAHEAAAHEPGEFYGACRICLAASARPKIQPDVARTFSHAPQGSRSTSAAIDHRSRAHRGPEIRPHNGAAGPSVLSSPFVGLRLRAPERSSGSGGTSPAQDWVRLRSVMHAV